MKDKRALGSPQGVASEERASPKRRRPNIPGTACARSVGVVAMWNDAKGCGTARIGAVHGRVFLSRCAIRGPLTSVEKGERIEFTLGTNHLGLVALDICPAPDKSLALILEPSSAQPGGSAGQGSSTVRVPVPVSARAVRHIG